jgi:PKD repeat protein
MKKVLLIHILIIFSLSVYSQNADFTFQTGNGLFCTPSTVTFTQISTGSPIGFLWNLGNGSYSSSSNPSTLYSLPGSYTVTLTTVYANSASTISKVVTISPPITVSIGYDRNYICVPGPINFTVAASANATSYQWNFGDGSPVFTTAALVAPHNYAAFGTYIATVTAFDAGGCSAAASTTISVMNPPISGVASPSSGCVPANVNLSASVTLPLGSSVTNYQWNFGDGSPIANTVVNNINNTYSVVGTYLPTLNITTSEGCTNSFSFPAIAYGTPPTGHVAYVFADTVCGSDAFTVVSKAATATAYTWNFNDGTVVTVTDTITTHKYATIGNHTITVTPNFNGCPGTTINLPVFVKGVIASFTSSNTCANKNNFIFNSTASQGNISTYLWDFGDGSPTSNLANPAHNFALGSYTVSLTINDIITGCSDVYRQTLYIATPSLINNKAEVCRNSPFTYSILNNFTNSAATYEWHVAGLLAGPNLLDSVTLNASLFGTFNNNFVIINNGAGYCPDTVLQAGTFKVGGPQVSFTASTIEQCLNAGPVTIKNTSSPYFAAEPIPLYYWYKGYGNTNDTIFQPQPYVLTFPGNFGIKLVARDINGCSDSVTNYVKVDPNPFIKTIPSTDSLCMGQSKTLIAFNSDTLSWLPAAYTCLSPKCDTISVSPVNSVTYFATAKNSYGCTSKDSVVITVFKPFKAMTTFADSAICKGQSIQLGAIPPGKKVLWQPNININNTTTYTPTVMPVTSQLYSVVLSDSVGCFTDSAYVNIRIKSLPIINAGPDKTYPYNTSYIMQPTYSCPISSYNWSPGTNLNCTNCAVPSGTSLVTTTYTLTAVSDSGCIATDSVTIFVACKDSYLYMPTAFAPADPFQNNRYYPLTRGIKTIKSLTIYNRYGQVVFQAKDFLPNMSAYGWDGYFKGIRQPAAGYVYFLDAICDIGQEVTKKGSFILVR